MVKVSILAAVAAFSSLCNATGKARVVNKCPFHMIIYSVGRTISEPYDLNAHVGVYEETFWKDPQAGGIALKIVQNRHDFYNAGPELIFAYNIVNAPTLTYALDSVFIQSENPWNDHKLEIVSDDTACPRVTWPSGVHPGGSSAGNCPRGEEANMTLTLCAS